MPGFTEEEEPAFDEPAHYVAAFGSEATDGHGEEDAPDDSQEPKDPLVRMEKWKTFPGISEGARAVLLADPKLTPRRAQKLAVKQAEVAQQVVKFKKGRQDEEDEDPNPERHDGSLKPAQPYVDLPPFNIFIALTILLNAWVIGLDTNLAAGNDVVLPQSLVTALQYICLAVFVIELCLRIRFGGVKFFTSRTRRLWNWMDIFVVGVALTGTLVLMNDSQGDNLRLIMLTQVLKIIRLLRLIRFVPVFHELWLVSNGLLNALKVLTWVCGILFVVIYMFSIVCTLSIGQNDDLYDPYYKESGGWDHEVYFGTTARSMFTMVQVLTLDDWADGVVRHVLAQQPGMAVLFLIFIMAVALGFMAVTVGVIVENTLHTTTNDAQYMENMRERDRQAVFSQLRDILQDADTDGSGSLDLPEVERATRKPEVYNKLKMIDFPVEDPQAVFDLLAFQRPQELTIDEFITGCMRMKGQAKSRDLLVAQVALDGMKTHYEKFEKQSKRFHKKLKELDKTVKALVFQGELVFLNPQEYRLRHPDWKASESPQATEADLAQAPWLDGSGASKHKKPGPSAHFKQGSAEQTRFPLDEVEEPEPLEERNFTATHWPVNLPGAAEDPSSPPRRNR